MAVIEMKALLEAGVHFGHKTKRWNPKMAKYIFGERNNTCIINLKKTIQQFSLAYDFVRDLSLKGESVLFVGTKRQAHEVVEEEAKRCGMYYVNHRWLGGMLTNFTTIKQSIKKLKRLESAGEDGTYERLPKKEVIKLEKDRVQLEKTLGGIKEMGQLPSAVFVVDTIKERTAVLEARKLGIPIIAIVDTNCNPDEIDFVVPGNDDGVRSVRFITQKIADAALEGQMMKKEEAASPPPARPHQTPETPPADKENASEAAAEVVSTPAASEGVSDGGTPA
ncbi:MAG: 30S ribosomal protein S2 [Nitrospiria bacterium]